MKKKNFFLAHKQFTFFLILALLIIITVTTKVTKGEIVK